MKFSLAATVLALASVAVAAPNRVEVRQEQEHGIKASQNTCGKAQISCCNKETTKIDNNASGIDKNDGALNELLKLGKIQDIGVFDQCSKLDVGVSVIGGQVQDLLKQKCKQQVACCQDTNGKAEGAVALNVPCIPVNLV